MSERLTRIGAGNVLAAEPNASSASRRTQLPGAEGRRTLGGGERSFGPLSRSRHQMDRERRGARIGGDVNESIQSAAAVLNVVAVVAVAVFVHRATTAAQRLAVSREQFAEKMEFDRELKNAWIAVDSEALASDEALKVFDDLLHPEEARGASIEERRRRWASYLLLNV